MTDSVGCGSPEDSIEGLIHISELSDKRVNHPKEVVQEGQWVTLRVIRALPGHARPIYGVAMTPDQTVVATASSDRTVRLWGPADGTFRVLNGHTSDVYRCGFSRDGQRLVTASQDATVRVWDLQAADLFLDIDQALEGDADRDAAAHRGRDEES